MQLRNMPITGTDTAGFCLIPFLASCVIPSMAGRRTCIAILVPGVPFTTGVAVFTTIRLASVHLCMHAISIQRCLVCFVSVVPEECKILCM